MHRLNYSTAVKKQLTFYDQHINHNAGVGFKAVLAKKIYRLKEDQAFSLSLELGRREKVARHPSADFLLHSVGGGGDFVDTVIVVKVV